MLPRMAGKKMGNAGRASDPIEILREKFRRQLEQFYAGLKLAPPYHSVEKAIAALTTSLKSMALEERGRVLADPAVQWQLYSKAFTESGLHLKHRGIITGMVRANQVGDLPPGHEHFLSAYLE